MDADGRELERLTVQWTEDVLFFVRTKGFAIDVDAARRTARGIAESIIKDRREAADHHDERRRILLRQGNICASLSLGYSKSEAATRVGISRETLRSWAREDEDFRRALRDAEARGRAQRLATAPPRRAPRLMRQSVRDAITTLLSQGMTRREALAEAGVSKQTFYTWLHRAPEFREAVLAAEGRPASQ